MSGESGRPFRNYYSPFIGVSQPRPERSVALRRPSLTALELAELPAWLVMRGRELTCTHCWRTASTRLRAFIEIHWRCNGEMP